MPRSVPVRLPTQTRRGAILFPGSLSLAVRLLPPSTGLVHSQAMKAVRVTSFAFFKTFHTSQCRKCAETSGTTQQQHSMRSILFLNFIFFEFFQKSQKSAIQLFARPAMAKNGSLLKPNECATGGWQIGFGGMRAVYRACWLSCGLPRPLP